MSDWEEGQQPWSLGTGYVLSETDRALRFHVEGRLIWVPKSVIHDDSEVWGPRQEAGNVVVQKWWADKNWSEVRTDDWEEL